ncbi:ATP-binding protein [Streptomyces sp. NPDC088747]|uniref:ATP-binding protein n=1 Tax=Streptomyces sp. NPDC088747 TaxID=3365886 RepID=UPI00382855DA
MRQQTWIGRFPVQFKGASTPWRGAKEVSGVALVVAQEVPASSSMAVPHGPAGVGQARHRMRDQLRTGGVPETVIDDAVLILSELLSNACRHGRPLGDALAGDGDVRAAWRVDPSGRLTVEVTDGGGPTRPVPATPSVTARGGRGLNIITALAEDWGVRDDAHGEITVWVVVRSSQSSTKPARQRDDPATRVTSTAGRHRPLIPRPAIPDLDFADAFDDLA